MGTQSKKQLRFLNKILENEYGVFLDNTNLTELADKLSRLTLLAKKHKAQKMINKHKHLHNSIS